MSGPLATYPALVSASELDALMDRGDKLVSLMRSAGFKTLPRPVQASITWEAAAFGRYLQAAQQRCVTMALHGVDL